MLRGVQRVALGVLLRVHRSRRRQPCPGGARARMAGMPREADAGREAASQPQPRPGQRRGPRLWARPSLEPRQRRVGAPGQRTCGDERRRARDPPVSSDSTRQRPGHWATGAFGTWRQRALAALNHPHPFRKLVGATTCADSSDGGIRRPQPLWWHAGVEGGLSTPGVAWEVGRGARRGAAEDIARGFTSAAQALGSQERHRWQACALRAAGC
mmetsp:Transcript_96050/g.277381  ORF Transcript_96050/g.277381 Transcript_96050/m.277381 type:complete len:213 (-) Transcript_96050:196-834(-)